MRYWMFTPDFRNNILISLYQVGYEKNEPKSNFGPYVRDFYLIHYIVSGKGKFECKGKIYELKEGDLFLIKPGLQTKYYADKDEPYEYYWIGFQGLKCDELVDSMGFDDENYVVHYGKSERLITLFENSYYYTKEISIKQYLNVYKNMYEILFLLSNKDTFYKKKYQGEDVMKNAISFIEEHYMEKIGVENIAKAISLSRSQTYRLFMENLGIPPSKYLLNYRLDKAINLVLQTKLSIKEIAFSCGFSNVSHFISLYRKKGAFTPIENRKIHYKDEKLKRKE